MAKSAFFNALELFYKKYSKKPLLNIDPILQLMNIIEDDEKNAH